MTQPTKISPDSEFVKADFDRLAIWAARLRQARRDAGLTQTALAAKADVFQPEVALIEAPRRHRRPPSAGRRALIAAALGRDVHELFPNPEATATG